MVNFLVDLLSNDDDPLDPHDREGLIRSTLPAFLEQGYSGAAALRAYQSAGLGINESRFYAIRREVLGIETRAARIISVGLDRIPTDRIFEPSDTVQNSNYRIIYEAKLYDTQTGTERKYVFGWDTDSLSTIRDMQDEAFSWFKERYPQFADIIVDIKTSKGLISKG